MSDSLKIKVCGMRDKSNILALAALKPDYMGFIFYEKSKRFVGENFDPSIFKYWNKEIKKVGVFVNHSNEYIVQKAEKYQLDVLQLHGDESPEQCAELKKEGCKIIKVFQVDITFDFQIIEPYKKHIDYLLLDTKSEQYGGTGKKFDYEIFKRYDNKIPLFLSGGLDMNSIDEIKNLTYLAIHALDINSKFEVEPGLKDITLIKKFINELNVWQSTQ